MLLAAWVVEREELTAHVGVEAVEAVNLAGGADLPGKARQPRQHRR